MLGTEFWSLGSKETSIGPLLAVRMIDPRAKDDVHTDQPWHG